MFSRHTTSSSPSSLSSSLLFLSVLLLSLSFSASFYLPGVAPNDYEANDPINVKVIKLDSVKTQLPYDYYSLPFCRPTNNKIQQEDENLGEVLSGDQIETSPYTVYMKLSETCKVLCVKEYTDEELASFADKIEDEYRVNWLLDNIPAATKYYTVNVMAAEGGADGQAGKPSEPIEHYEKGYALGFVGHPDFPNSKPGVKYINNHLRLNIKYHHEDITPQARAQSQALAASASPDGTLPTPLAGGDDPSNPAAPQSSAQARIVGFEIEAYSVHHVVEPGFTYNADTTKLSELQEKLVTCRQENTDTKPQPVSDFEAGEEKRIIFTYDVQWDPSTIKWASRWDTYLKMTDSKIHCN